MAEVRYELIEDWSREARAKLVEARGNEIRLLLDEAFQRFFERPERSLAEFFPHGDDPFIEAVEWVVDRFVRMDLDPTRLNAGSGSFRLFTEVKFWLSQRLGEQGYKAWKGRTEALRRAPMERIDREPADAGLEADVRHGDFHDRVAAALRALGRRTCPDLVMYWLVGTRRFCEDWFGLSGEGELSNTVPAARKSKIVADALFRYIALYTNVVDDESGGHTCVCQLTLFDGCPNSPPYRAKADLVIRRLRLQNTKVFQRQLKAGVTVLAGSLVEQALVRSEDADEPPDVLLVRACLKGSLRHVYRIEQPSLVKALKERPWRQP